MTPEDQSPSVPPAGTFCWNELITNDVDQAVAFYTELFGWTTEQMDVGEEGTYTFFKCGKRGVGGVIKMSGPAAAGPSSHWLTYVSVEDIDASVDKATSLRAKVIEPINAVPNVGRIAIIEDPGRARVALYESD